MQKAKRVRNRWFTAVAVTCLSGFALCGCARGTRDVASNLQDSAAREAKEAERHVAERKREASQTSKSKESLASKERSESPFTGDKQSRKNSFERKEPTKKSADLAMQPSKKPSKATPKKSGGELETAEWASDSSDRRVKTVSGEKEVDELDVAEPLLDKKGREAVASDLFDEEKSKSNKKPVIKEKTTAKSLTAKSGLPSPDKVNLDESEEHPWAQKSPVVSRSKESEPSAKQNKSVPRLEASEAAKQPERATASKKLETLPSDQPVLDEAQQLEAMARVQTLLTQSKSFVKKGELRSAYRVAQMAQRIADSEELFFSAGEEQPADVVRSVLMKIRFEENKLASRSEEVAPESEAEALEGPSRKGKLASHSNSSFSNLPDGWTPVSGHAEKTDHLEAPGKPDSSHSPWAKGEVITAVPHSMRIKPGPSSRSLRTNPAFPESQDQWRSVSNVPLTLGQPVEVEASSFATDQGAFQKSKVVQADTKSTPAAELHPADEFPSEAASTHGAHLFLPRTFPETSPFPSSSDGPSAPEKPASEPLASAPLASAEDWRTQDLSNLGTSRSPLLVAPAPPAEPSIEKILATDAIAGTMGIDVQEPPAIKQPESKLWMILAAAGGACAMLFVRRRPAALPRSGGSGR